MKKNHITIPHLFVCCKAIFWVLMVAAMVYLVAGQYFFPNERERMASRVLMLTEGWEQVLPDAGRLPVTSPGTATVALGDSIVIERQLTQEDCTYPYVSVYAKWADCDIFVGDELRLHYDTKDSRPFGKNSATRFIFAKISQEDVGRTLSIHTHSTSRYYNQIARVCLSDKAGIWESLLAQQGSLTIMSLLLLLFSIICIIICIGFCIVYKRSISLTYLGLAAVLCAGWLLSESVFRQVFFSNLSVIAPLPFICLLLVPFPVLIYMNETQKKRHEMLYTLGLLYSIIITVILTLLQVFNVSDYQKNVLVIHSGILITAAIVLVTFIMDYRKGYHKEYLLTIIGVGTIILCGLAEMLGYYFNPDFRLGFYIVCGLLILMWMAAIHTGKEVLFTEHEKQRALDANAAKAKFLAGMSHEIRTPINTIIGMNEMILRENQDPDIAEYAKNIHNSGKMLLGLVNDILDFSKIESGQLHLLEGEYGLASLINDEILSVSNKLDQKKLRLKVEIDESLPSGLFGDELRIRQILSNLLTNAIKYTEKGCIYLTFKGRGVDDDHMVLTILVEDTGIGIRETDLEKLFDSFTRLDEQKNRHIEGFGLGLNIVKLLVNLMHGEITVTSKYGEGSAFCVKIPQRITNRTPVGNIQAAYRPRKSTVRHEEESFLAPDAHVLVVDDNEMNLSVIKGLLKHTQIHLDLCNSGNECLEKAKQQRYDLILMDHMMPILDGIETLHLIRSDASSLNQTCPVIALTANAVAGSREMYIRYGFNDYLSKPIEHLKLERMVVKYLPKDLLYIGTTENMSETETL